MEIRKSWDGYGTIEDCIDTPRAGRRLVVLRRESDLLVHETVYSNG